ncbi:hypothetical protein LCGC14_1088180 [marine sediment metagenome]|uniref:Phosphoribosylglycinamide synthetase ATP-grasp (A) domain-containing protein n=1 Tax=marine sediment metagenome TaxID=412755 RepID=A0A0F9MHM9_9ZZZZ
MKAFLFISKQGDGCALANRIMSEGHRSILYINVKKNRRVGDGIVEKSSISEELILRDGRVRWGILDQLLKTNPDVVVMDMVGRGFGKVAERIRELGVPVVGGSVFGNTVELNRPYGSQVMKMMGIPVPETHVFNGFPEAIRFIESSKGAYVYKPSGNKPTHTTYVANGKEDMVGMLKHYSGQRGEFGLQKRVSGIEVSTELWFNGKEVLNVNHTMEEKSLMDNGIGAKTGSMGSVVWEGHQDSRLYRVIDKELEEQSKLCKGRITVALSILTQSSQKVNCMVLSSQQDLATTLSSPSLKDTEVKSLTSCMGLQQAS